ncbi:11601_t:CDS:2, partial [Ambispora gerdemannii]
MRCTSCYDCGRLATHMHGSNGCCGACPSPRIVLPQDSTRYSTSSPRIVLSEDSTRHIMGQLGHGMGQLGHSMGQSQNSLLCWCCSNSFNERCRCSIHSYTIEDPKCTHCNPDNIIGETVSSPPQSDEFCGHHYACHNIKTHIHRTFYKDDRVSGRPCCRKECKIGPHRSSGSCWCCKKPVHEGCRCSIFRSLGCSAICATCRPSAFAKPKMDIHKKDNYSYRNYSAVIEECCIDDKSEKSPMPIVLWCHPRSCSSAFQRAFLQRPQEFKCFQEPCRDDDSLSMIFGKYYQREKDHRKSQNQFYEDNKPLRVFAKDMAYFIRDKYGPNVRNPSLPRSTLSMIRHTFLIREPSKSVKSLYRQMYSQWYKSLKESGFDFRSAIDLKKRRIEFGFNTLLIGIKELAEFFKYVREEFSDQTSLVIDADDLCKDPRGVLVKYCKLIGEEFDESMISWKPGKVENVESWRGWHSEDIPCSTTYRLTTSTTNLANHLRIIP